MKTWDDWSDFEVNKEIAILFGSKKADRHPNSAIVSGLRQAVSTDYGCKDYCNNPADMWPLIVASKIGIIPPMDYECDEIWTANVFDADGDEALEYIHHNPLRAAAIVFLMMNGVNPND